MIYFRAQNGVEIWPMRPIFSTPLKVTQIDKLTEIDAKPAKITKDRNFDLFGGPKWHKNRASEAHILHTCKSTCNKHVKQNWCKINENFLRKWPKIGILTYLGLKMAQKLDLWSPYSPYIQKYLQRACEAIPMWNQLNFLEKMTNGRNFDLFWGPKMVKKNWAFKAHTVHISESSCNEHIKQVWCESQRK